MKRKTALLSMSVALAATLASGQSGGLGLFTGQGDIGRVNHLGSARYDAANGTYFVSGSGENMWFTNDAFHFVWKEASGECSLAANIRWPGTKGNAHRKACLLIRQGLESDAAYADVAVHGDGLTSLQYRESRGGATHEIQSNVSAPSRVRLEKRGNYVFISVAKAGGDLQPGGGSLRMRFAEPFYIGLGVCSHDSNVLEQAEFSAVELKSLQPVVPERLKLQSTLEVVTIASKDRRVVYHTTNHIEAPNWSSDGKAFVFNSAGRLYKLPVSGGAPEPVDTGFAVHCNNDHGLSPDGKQLAISDQTADGKSRIYVLPFAGGTPRQVTKLGPSYWHGWSPDGRTLAYCAERNGEFDIYTMPVESGEEKRLTTVPGLDDGPDYSPDGKWIYFNSERTGLMQIWRMRPDGSEQQAVTTDDYNNWFAHPSPDGKWLVLLTYDKSVKGHPANQDVMLRLMPLGGGEIQVLAKFFGGQGTINVPSWSPDSRSVAFMSYRLGEP